MSLICTSCSKDVPAGFGHCPSCNMGFLTQLRCKECNATLLRGTISCPACDRNNRVRKIEENAMVVVQLDQTAARPATALARSNTGLPGAILVPGEYQAGKLGVNATVQIPQEHVDAMNDLGKLIPVLHGVASRLVVLPGDGVRQIARSMRLLAADIQEEIEKRVGPQS